MEEAADLAALVVFQRRLLEAADADHLSQKADLFLLRELRVDGRGGGVFGFDGCRHSSGVGVNGWVI